MGLRARFELHANFVPCDPTLVCESSGLPTEKHFQIITFDRATELQPARHVFREEQVSWLRLDETAARNSKRRSRELSYLRPCYLAVRFIRQQRRVIAPKRTNRRDRTVA